MFNFVLGMYGGVVFGVVPLTIIFLIFEINEYFSRKKFIKECFIHKDSRFTPRNTFHLSDILFGSVGALVTSLIMWHSLPEDSNFVLRVLFGLLFVGM